MSNHIVQNDYVIRTLKREDMNAYTECMYSVYGDTYPNKIAYHPEVYMDAVENGRYYAAAAFTEDGELAGHTSLWEWTNIPGVFELGMCAVKEEHRHHGLQERTVQACIEEARRDGTRGSLYTEAICDHPYSQRTFYKCGLRPCGFTFNHYRPTILVSSFSDPNAYTSLCMLSVPLKHTKEIVYYPKELGEVLDGIYRDCGYERDMIPATPGTGEGEDDSSYSYSELLNVVNLCFYRLGTDSVEKFKHYQVDIAAKGADVMHVHLSMRSPGLSDLYEEARKEGYFFCGIIPDTKYGDMIYLQKMVNCEVDFDRIVCTDETFPLLNSIKKLKESTASKVKP